jgi:hypothetical protein
MGGVGTGERYSAASQAHGRVLQERGRRLAGVINAAAAGLVAVVAEALETDAWAGWGINTPTHWVGLRFGVSSWRAKRLVAAAIELRDLPVCRAAFEAGEISEDHVAVIVRARPKLIHDDHVAYLAKFATVGQFETAMRTVPSRPGDDKKPKDKKSERDAPGVVSSNTGDDGRWRLRADGDPIGGALVDKALAAARDDLFRSRHDDPDGDVSKVSQWDALLHLAGIGLDALDPATAKSPARRPSDRYVVNVHVNADDPDQSRIHLGPLVPEHLRQELTCDGWIRLWRHNAQGDTVDVGRTRRVVDAKQRLIVEHRDGGCVIPGCGCTRFLHIHHITHWEHGGATDISNLVAVCGGHHRALHRGEYTITRSPDGTLVFTGADGRPIGPTPPITPQPDEAFEAVLADLGIDQPRWECRSGERAQWHWLTWQPEEPPDPPPSPN